MTNNLKNEGASASIDEAGSPLDLLQKVNVNISDKANQLTFSRTYPFLPHLQTSTPPLHRPPSTALIKLKESSKSNSTANWATIQTLSSPSLASHLAYLFLDKFQAEEILTGDLDPSPAFPEPASANHSSSDGALEKLMHVC